jgi:uncharacterized protein
MTGRIASRPPETLRERARRRRRPPRGGHGPTMTAAEVIAATLFGLVVAVFLNASALVDDAERQPFGPDRDRSLAVWRPVEDVATALQLTRGRETLDDLIGRGDDEAPPPTSAAEATPPTSAVPVPTTAPPPALLRRPSATAPLSAYVAGDSLMQELGTAFVRRAEATTLYTATLDYRISTGLTRPDYFDWPAHLRDELATRQPDLVVITFGANDAQGIETPGGAIFQMDEVADWDREYRRRVGEAMDELEAGAVRTYWVGLPPMRDADFDRRMQRLNAIYREEAELRPDITFVDAVPVLGDARGGFQDLVDVGGEVLDLRQSDGIHLGVDGANLLAEAVLATVADDIDPVGTAPTTTPTSPASSTGSTTTGG